MPVTLEPMTHARLRPWIEAGRSAYLADLLRAGESPERAQEKALRSFDDYFPGGVPLDGHHAYDVANDGEHVGWVWIGPQQGPDPTAWWVWDLEIVATHRGRGFGRQTMVLAEAAAKELGAARLGLNVFGFNHAARALYESLGYEIQSIQMSKHL